MGGLREAADAEVIGWTAGKYLEDHGEDFAIENLADVKELVGRAAEQVHERGAAHLITEIAVWPDLAEAEALITLDLPSGLRLSSLCISHKHLVPDRHRVADTVTVVQHVLASVLSVARALAEEYRTGEQRGNSCPLKAACHPWPPPSGLPNGGADAAPGAPVYVVTRADVERIAGRAVTPGELEQAARAIAWSSIPGVLDTVITEAAGLTAPGGDDTPAAGAR